jgi:hypothetical protein
VYVFVFVNVWLNVKPLLCTPESHGVQLVHGGPGVQPPGVHVPDVVE